MQKFTLWWTYLLTAISFISSFCSFSWLQTSATKSKMKTGLSTFTTKPEWQQRMQTFPKLKLKLSWVWDLLLWIWNSTMMQSSYSKRTFNMRGSRKTSRPNSWYMTFLVSVITTKEKWKKPSIITSGMRKIKQKKMTLQSKKSPMKCSMITIDRSIRSKKTT